MLQQTVHKVTTLFERFKIWLVELNHSIYLISFNNDNDDDDDDDNNNNNNNNNN